MWKLQDVFLTRNNNLLIIDLFPLNGDQFSGQCTKLSIIVNSDYSLCEMSSADYVNIFTK